MRPFAHPPVASAAGTALATAAFLAATALATPLGAQAPGTDVYLFPLQVRGGTVSVGAGDNLTRRAGYDNQPVFTADGQSVLYTSERDDAQTDIWRVDITTREASRVIGTPESEYSATHAPLGGGGLAVIRVEIDSAQRLWHFPQAGEPRALFPSLKPVGYFAFADSATVVMFVLGQPATLQLGNLTTGATRVVGENVGRSIHRMPGSTLVSYVQKGADGWTVRALDARTSTSTIIAPIGPRVEDYAWASADVMLMARGDTLHRFHVGHDSVWMPVAPLGVSGASRLAVSPDGRALAVVARDAESAETSVPASIAEAWGDLEVLTADSLAGRMTGTPGEKTAARYLAGRFAEAGLQPLGDAGTHLQRVPVAVREGTGARRVQASRIPGFALPADAPEGARLDSAYNVIGMIRGSDPVLRDEVVLVTAHFDHVGIGAPVNGDSIYNGADDDASGTAALVEIARRMAAGAAPRRTVVFAAVTGEEAGLIGTRWYIDNPPFPLTAHVANFNLEMLGRPDSLAGGPGRAWLTGYERSNMGDQLAAQGIPIVADPRPAQNFFRRSDNYAFARIGIVAHTLSSFGLHTDYHRPGDELRTMDATHYAAVIDAAERATRILADGATPAWKPGGRPEN